VKISDGIKVFSFSIEQVLNAWEPRRKMLRLRWKRKLTTMLMQWTQSGCRPGLLKFLRKCHFLCSKTDLRFLPAIKRTRHSSRWWGQKSRVEVERLLWQVIEVVRRKKAQQHIWQQTWQVQVAGLHTEQGFDSIGYFFLK